MAVKLNSAARPGAIERAVSRPAPETFPIGLNGSNQREAAVSRGKHHGERRPARPDPFPPNPSPATPDNNDSFLDELGNDDDPDNSDERKIKLS